MLYVKQTREPGINRAAAVLKLTRVAPLLQSEGAPLLRYNRGVIDTELFSVEIQITSTWYD